METKLKLPGAKVVALVDSIESTIGFRNQADLRRVQTARDIHEELESGRVQGALMDAYLLVYFNQNYPTRNLDVQEVIQQDKLEYGVRVKNTKLANCFREKRYTMESVLYEIAEFSLEQSLSSGAVNEDKEHRKNLFDPEGMLFFPMLFVCLGVTAVLLIAGAAWELWNKFHSQIFKKGKREDMQLSLTKTRRGDRASCVKCYISLEKLQDLENKVQEMNQALDIIKNGVAFDMHANKLSPV